MQPQLKTAIKEIKLTLQIKGEKKEVPCYVYEYTQRCQELPQFPLGGNTVTIKKIVDCQLIEFE